MKRILLSVTFIALFFIAARICEAQAVSRSYRLSVHIPAIAGINVPVDDPSAEFRAEDVLPAFTKDVRQVEREGQQIVLETILIR